MIANHKVLVPAVDQFGHDIAGIRHPHIEVPMGTHLGWNIRTTEFGGGDLCDENGSFIPLSIDDSAAGAANDSRPSLLATYSDYQTYVEKINEATAALVSQKLLLPKDAAILIEQVEQNMLMH